jgi:hypothetical protein
MTAAQPTPFRQFRFPPTRKFAPMNHTYSRVYDSYDQAERTVRDLEAQGVHADNISLVANKYVSSKYEEVTEVSFAATGAGVGAVAGGGVGLLAGLGMLAIPGLGPVVAAGWLAATAAGAVAGMATGGIIGALVDVGTSESDAHVYSEAVRRGGTLVTVRTDKPAANIELAMDRQGPIDPAQRRREYEALGWTGFDAKAPAYRPDQTEIDRMRRRAA